MIHFDPTRSYRPDLDVRDWSEWVSRLEHDQPTGVAWTLLGLRRSGKSWALAALKHRLTTIECTVLDLAAHPDALDQKTHQGCILIDEPGAALAADPSKLIKSCEQHKQNGARVLVALTPGEWARLAAADPQERFVKHRDRRGLPSLNAAQAERLARTDWAKAMLPQLPEAWKRSPFLLELLFERTGSHPPLQNDVAAAMEAALDACCDSRLRYIEQIFVEGTSETQKATLRAVARSNPAKIDKGSFEILAESGAVEGPRERAKIADPILADHLPAPLIIHHISDVHFGDKTAAAVDQKENNNAANNLARAAAPATIRDAYARHLDAHKNTPHAAHVLIVSGDVAETGKNTELEDAASWLESLRPALAAHADLESTAQRILIVGGNHDVDWTVTRGPAGARKRHLAFARAFDHRRFPRPRLEEPPEKRQLTAIAYRDCGVEIVLLGSAELGGEIAEEPELKELANMFDQLANAASKALDTGELERYARLREHVNRIDPGLVHERDLTRLRAHDFTCPVRIAVLHHPVSPVPAAPEIARFAGLLNAGAVKDAMFAAGICLVLHGHQHSGWIAKESWPGRYQDRALHIASAPTLGSRETQEHLGFNEVRVFREGSDRYEVAVQRFVRKGVEWVPDGAPALFVPNTP